MDLFGDQEERSMLYFEERARQLGHRVVAGIDEAGRGALAGPVVAAAVILPEGEDLPGVTDSKQLPSAKRDEYYDLIMSRALAVGVGFSDNRVIDDINILQATLAAMKKAILALSPAPDYLLIDGISKVGISIPQQTIKKGDSLSRSIAAASIIAKVSRDRYMVELEQQFPGYGLAEHKGYGCAAHLSAIALLGPSAVHRLSFGGVKEHLQPDPGADQLCLT